MASPTVRDWLCGLRLETYHDAFVNNGYDDLAVCAELSEEDLDSMGITLPGHRRRLLAGARRIMDPSAPDAASYRESAMFEAPAAEPLATSPLSPSPIAQSPLALEDGSSPKPPPRKPPKLPAGSRASHIADDTAGKRASMIGEPGTSQSPSAPRLSRPTPASLPVSLSDSLRSVDLRRHTGFLSKQGGANNNKGWQRRYCVWNGAQLEYYKAEVDKEPAGVIALAEMLELRTPRSTDPKYRYLFEVVTKRQRTYLFCADGSGELEEWTTLLRAAICGEEQTGGSAVAPSGKERFDKGGWLKKQGNNMARDWKKRYITVKDGEINYYKDYEDFERREPISTINTLTVSVKIDDAQKFRFQIVTLNRTYFFQAENGEDMQSWITAIQNSILFSLNSNTSDKAKSQQGSVTKASRPMFMSGLAALESVRELPENLRCADCNAENPDWASINLGILVCIECSGIHRSMGVHISKVRSVTLDEWSPHLVAMMKAVSNARSNEFWEANIADGFSKPAPDQDRTTRENYVRAKYERKAFCRQSRPGATRDVLGKELVANAATEDLVGTIELLALGAPVDYASPDAENRTALHAAAHAGRLLQAILLLQNGATATVTDCRGYPPLHYAETAGHEDMARVIGESVAKALNEDRAMHESASSQSQTYPRKRGYLQKQGGSNKGWRRRYIVMEGGALRYYKNEGDASVPGREAGAIHSWDMTGVSPAWEDRDNPKSFRYCFTVQTGRGRDYAFCADSAGEMNEWMDALKAMVPANATPSRPRREQIMEGATRTGHLYKRGGTNTSWKRRFFILKGKELFYFKSEEDGLPIDSIDMRRVTNMGEGEGGAKTGGEGEPGSFHLASAMRTFYLRADTREDMVAWLQALKNTQVFGVLLQELLKNSPRRVPRIVEFALGYVEKHGLESEGIYRLSGQSTAIQQLRILVNQDEEQLTEAVCTDVHDVSGLLKLYFREMPEPLMTFKGYADFIASSRIQDHDSRLYELQRCVYDLPIENFWTLKMLMAHLAKVSERQAVNKMGTSNLAIVFGPTLMTVSSQDTGVLGEMSEQYRVVQDMVTYHEWMFGRPEEEDPRVAERAKRMPAVSAGASAATAAGAPTAAPEGGHAQSVDMEAKMEEFKRKLEAAQAQTKSTNAQDTSSIAFNLEVYVEPLGTTATLAVTGAMSAREMVDMAVQKCSLQHGDWAVYEVLRSGYLERELSDDEKVLRATSQWELNTQNHLMIRRATVRPMLLELIKANPKATLTTMTPVRGFLHKEGGSHKSWKKRYFVTMPDGLYYYKDASAKSTPLGSFPFKGLLSYYVRDHKKAPTRHCFGLRIPGAVGEEDAVRFLCADEREDVDRWVASLAFFKYLLDPPKQPLRQPPPKPIKKSPSHELLP